MSKWRPYNDGCIFVIPDIHGRFDELDLILNRILPLRNNKNAKDLLIFLGDYIDRGPKSPEVLDKLIELNWLYNNQVVFLRGNHEDLLLKSVGLVENNGSLKQMSPYATWHNNGGKETLLQYAHKSGLSWINLDLISKERVLANINNNHIDFLFRNTRFYFELDKYIFVHAGCDPNIPLQYQDEAVLFWDRSLFLTCKEFSDHKINLPWDKTIVTGHNCLGPFLMPGFFMLDASNNQELIILELNSMESYSAKYGNRKLLKTSITVNV